MVIKKTKKLLYLILGWLFLAIAILGIPLPILPTTPFLLLSAYFFSQSSEKLHQWLLHTKYLGPMITNWERYGVIRLRAKILSVALIIMLFSYTLIFIQVNYNIKIIVTLIGVAVITFIITRPSEISQIQKNVIDEKSLKQSILEQDES